MAASSPLEAVVQSISHDRNIARIKKLLVYTCTNIWESDPARLDEFDLAGLLQDLLAIAPSLEHLRCRLDGIVQHINKRAEYTLVATSLLHHVVAMYQSDEPVTTINPSANPSANGYGTVAAMLESDPEALRIKKMLLYLRKNVWENDPLTLSSFSVATLVQELHQITPTVNEFAAALSSIVKNLNRQDVYQPIADRVIAAFQELYTNEPATHLVDDLGMHGPGTHLLVEPTGIQGAIAAHPAIAPIGAPIVTQLNVSAVPSASPAAPHPMATGIQQGVSASNHSDQGQISRPIASRIKPPKELPDLFDLRLELMKYTNPLRTKILLFSLLHGQPELDAKAWLSIKNYDLDDLLKYVLQTYKVLIYLEADLRKTASNLPDAKQYGHTVTAILRLITPLYSGAIKGMALTLDQMEGHHSSSRSPSDRVAQPSGSKVADSGGSGGSGSSDQISSLMVDKPDPVTVTVNTTDTNVSQNPPEVKQPFTSSQDETAALS